MILKKVSSTICALLSLCILFVNNSTPAFALAEYNDAESATYFIATSEGMYQVSPAQYEEIVSGQSEVSTVFEEGILCPDSSTPSDVCENVQINMTPSVMRTTGTWNINTYSIGPNIKTTFSKSDGSSFDVGEDEYIELTVITEEPRSFQVGYNGTSEFSAWVYTDSNYGNKSVIAFIDSIVVPGSYRVFISNYDTIALVVSGEIRIAKR